ncbi:hypothetical protein CA265_05940 [Sphingobacteriaceae bacterium GW460-11-11-14-LB5]|nr:hypothetical protein CA265_05940 [Sphingobacteriaceae bacterium GW460-11-11-14-LB5]
MLACLKEQTDIAEERPSIPSAGKSKKQLHNRTSGTTKPKTQWFCTRFLLALPKHLKHKTKCRWFFDANRLCVNAHCWIDEAL